MTAFADLTSFELDRGMIQHLDEEFCLKHQVVLLGRTPESKHATVALGMLDVSDTGLIQIVKRKTGWEVHPVQLNSYELDVALGTGFGIIDDEDDYDEELPSRNLVVEVLELSHANTIRFDREQSIPQIVLDTLSEAIRQRASDVHIETYADDVDLRFRVDGVLRQISTPISPENVRAVVSYLKVHSNLDMAEHRTSQDGRITTDYLDRTGESRRIDMRVSILPGMHGEDAVLRVLDSRRLSLGLGDLGMSPELLKDFTRLLNSPGGMILVTGPTASGKTTSLYAAVQAINTDESKILTVEDPVEYELQRVNQKQVGRCMSFDDYARAFMRQNPDVVLIGEVRDEETARISLRAAQMGHLVLTTVHTRNAAAAVGRLLSLGIDRELLASGLLGVLGQRLVRRNCTHCCESYTPSSEGLDCFPSLPEKMTFMRGAGCAECSGTGYHGQIGIFELLRFDRNIRAAVASGESLEAMDIQQPKMLDDAVEKMAAGVTTVEEVLRAVPRQE